MSLDNIQLQPIILQNLYSKSLYDLNIHKPGDDLSPTNKLYYLGNNRKKIAILVSSADAIYLEDEDLNFLLDILSACKLNMEDIALINVFKNPVFTYKEITEQLNAEKIFLFGTDPDVLGLPLQFPYYQLQHYNNQVYLSSPPLNNLQNNKEEKMKLWNCLKKTFSLG